MTLDMLVLFIPLQNYTRHSHHTWLTHGSCKAQAVLLVILWSILLIYGIIPDDDDDTPAYSHLDAYKDLV